MPAYRIRIHPERRTTTIAGIPVHVLSASIVCSDLHCYEDIKQQQKILDRKSSSKRDKEGAKDMIAHLRGVLLQNKRIMEALHQDSGPVDMNRRRTIDERRAILKHNQLMEKLLEDIKADLPVQKTL